ncbi:zf-HC2 domain-containing protein [Gordonia sputi]|uniref:zf-HC2 domain-containing protein n=1 Tax=Gordonia sputi TaxID=36823 RepID=UPI0020435635|nr:zf-HC2 domain-containing protein [Gordonia sputi]MCM3894911.1 zf-HC2 domain-containing protein [Gordonia sputi]
MRCEVARESLSARIDGERESVPAARVDEHVAQCPACQRWYSTAQGMNFAAADLAPDLSTTILEASQTSEPDGTTRRRNADGVGREVVALHAASVACAVAAVVLSVGYLTGSAPLWYPVMQIVFAVVAIALAVAARVRSRRRGQAARQIPSATTSIDDDACEVDAASDVTDLAALRAKRKAG